MVGRRSKTSRLRRDAETIRDDVRELRKDARDAIEERFLTRSSIA